MRMTAIFSSEISLIVLFWNIPKHTFLSAGQQVLKVRKVSQERGDSSAEWEAPVTKA